MYRGSGSQSQISYPIEDGLVEFVHSSPLQSPVEYLTHVTADPPKVDIVLVVGHRILESLESEACVLEAGGDVLES